MSRKELSLRFRGIMESEGYCFKTEYEEISELWRDYLDLMLELGNITTSKRNAVYEHY